MARPIWIAIALFVLPAALAAADEPKWEEVYHEDQITVYRKEIPGTDVLAFKAEGLLDAPIGKILTVVTDTPHKKEWMAHCKDAEVLRDFSPTEKVEYIEISTPWPLKNRDAVFRSTIHVDPEAKRITLHYASVDDPKKPEGHGPVRALIYDALFSMEPRDHGRKTQFSAESHADPRGAIPKWIVNLYQKRIPHQSIERLLKRVAQPGIVDHPLAKLLGPLDKT